MSSIAKETKYKNVKLRYFRKIECRAPDFGFEIDDRLLSTVDQ